MCPRRQSQFGRTVHQLDLSKYAEIELAALNHEISANLVPGPERLSVPEDTSPDAPWKDGRERSERWKETLSKGFLPRVSVDSGSMRVLY